MAKQLSPKMAANLIKARAALTQYLNSKPTTPHSASVIVKAKKRPFLRLIRSGKS